MNRQVKHLDLRVKHLNVNLRLRPLNVNLHVKRLKPRVVQHEAEIVLEAAECEALHVAVSVQHKIPGALG